MLERLLQWDRNTFIYLNSLGIEKYDAFWATVTNTTTWIPLFLLFLYLFIRNFPRKEALLGIFTVALLVLITTLATDLTKEWVARLRPNNEPQINMFIRILKSPTGYSFFSGHASSSFSVTTLVVFILRQRISWIWLCYIWPLLYSFSRIYVGVHYPVDILVGALVGTTMAWIFYRIYIRTIVPGSGSGRPV